jgi:PhnB protein
VDITPYLTFDGTCREAFEAYARILGGEIELIQSYGETPMAAHAPADQRDRVMHARLRVGDRRIMGRTRRRSSSPSRRASRWRSR